MDFMPTLHNIHEKIAFLFIVESFFLITYNLMIILIICVRVHSI